MTSVINGSRNNDTFIHCIKIPLWLVVPITKFAFTIFQNVVHNKSRHKLFSASTQWNIQINDCWIYIFSSVKKRKKLFGGFGKFVCSQQTFQTKSIECKERKLKLLKIDLKLQKSHSPEFLTFSQFKKMASFMYFLLHIA